MTLSTLSRRMPHLAVLAGPRRRMAVLLVGVAALALYVAPGLSAPGAHWPLRDVRVYWWGARQAGQALYSAHAQFSFTYPPFAAALFRLGTTGTEGWLAAGITVLSIGSLAVLVWLSLTAAGMRPHPETVFAVAALSALLWPVAYTLHLGEINLVVAAAVGADLLRQRDGGWWQGIGTGVAAGIKLTPLIFVVYLLITRRLQAAVTAAVAFAATITAGWLLLPAASRVFWLDGVFAAQSRVGNAANPSNQSLAGAVARLAGGRLTGAYDWWLAAALVCGLAGLAVAAWAHQRGWRLGGVCCCAITGLLVSPFSWAHHWVWAVPLLIWVATTAWRHRSVAGAAVTAAVAVVFSGLIPLTWPGLPVNPARMLASDQYVLCGLAVLAATAVILARQGRSPGRPGTASPSLAVDEGPEPGSPPAVSPATPPAVTAGDPPRPPAAPYWTLSRLRQLAMIAVFDLGGPLAAYALLRSAGMSPVAALVTSGILPALGIAIGAWVDRRLDIIAVMVLAGLAVGTILGLISHNARLYLVEGAVPSLIFALACLASLRARKPLIYRIAVELLGPDTPKGRDVAGAWRFPGVRRAFQVITAAWGIAYLVEVAARLAVVAMASTGIALVSSKLLPYTFALLLSVWTLVYGEHEKRKAERLAAAA